MEKIKVNMSPNPLDVQTIHASQNDTEARQWEFELHNNGELIDTSDITEQMFFKSYKGGTEQILPENTSTPTTSPFLGDIKYPQGLLNDQEFTYRQSPTEEDGLAKITDVKGNTLVWNQLAHELTSDYYGATYSGDVVSFNDGIASMTANHQYGGFGPLSNSRFSIVNGHKYLVCLSFKPTTTNTLFRYNYTLASSNIVGNLYTNTANVWNTSAIIHTARATGQSGLLFQDARTSGWDEIQVKNLQVFDLTKMGLDSLTVDDFTSLFPLSYYSYNQGSLLSFMGNGIKTVGFNQWDEEWEVGGLSILNGVPVAGSSQIRSKNFCPLIGGKTYYLTCGKTDGGSQNRFYLAICFYDAEQEFISAVYSNNLTFVAPSNASYFKICTNSSTVVYGNTYNNDICVNISSSRNGEYEPYTSSTLSLPISTYFPTGMKSAGTAYDELTPMKAIARIHEITIGSSSNIGKESTGWNPNIEAFYIPLNPHASWHGAGSVINNAKSDKLETVSYASLKSTAEPLKMAITVNGTYLEFTANFSSVDDLKTWLASNPIKVFYELVTPTETSFTTASLVTENAEIPLSNEDGTLIGKCTEQLSADAGFIEGKIKLSDEDGDVYSSKIQLHVERSPQ